MFCRHVFGNISGGFRGISCFLGKFAGPRPRELSEALTSTSDFTCVLFLRPVEEEVTNAKTSKDEEGFKSKGPQLSRKNSSKNVVSNF